MSRFVPLAILGGVITGGVYLITRALSPSKADAQLPPLGPPQDTPQQAEIKRLAAQAAVASAEAETKQKAVEAQLAKLTAAAKVAPPAQKKTLEQAKAVLVASAADSAKKAQAVKAELATKAQAEQAAKKAAEAKAAAGPFYMPGLQATFGKITATITEAHQDGQGAWHYTTLLKGTPLGIKDGSYPSSEVALRQQVSQRLGQPLAQGQAYPAGLQVFRNGVGGLIDRVDKNTSGTFLYSLRGWPNAIPQQELLGILARA